MASASNSSQPFHFGAYTVSVWSSLERTSCPTSSCRYDWIPPRRGGKSLVTSRTRAMTVRLTGQPGTPVSQHLTEVGAQRLGHGRLDTGMAGPAGPLVQAPQGRGAVPVGDESGEPPGAVVSEWAGAPDGLQGGAG